MFRQKPFEICSVAARAFQAAGLPSLHCAAAKRSKTACGALGEMPKNSEGDFNAFCMPTRRIEMSVGQIEMPIRMISNWNRNDSWIRLQGFRFGLPSRRAAITQQSPNKPKVVVGRCTALFEDSAYRCSVIVQHDTSFCLLGTQCALIGTKEALML